MRVFLLLFFLILGTQAADAQSVITVEVHENGNALWNVEKSLPLPDRTDIEDWEEFIKADQTENQQDVEDFRKSIEFFLVSAVQFSGRPMKLENVNISYDTAKSPSGAYGIIRYSFEWVNFSRKEKDKILIGDSFSEAMVLSQENVLVLKIPDGFDVESASPNVDKRDGNRLIWDGTLYRSFGKGEPAVALARSGINPWYLILILLVAAAGSFFMFTRRRPGPDTQSDQVSLENVAIEELKYEEKIERFLLSSGGQAPQSDIIKEIGLSKSRVSTILSQMKEKGQIIKIKNGSGNLIRIVKK